MTRPQRTITVPSDKRPAQLDGPDPITALRERGGATEHALLPQESTFSIGSSTSCDIALPSPYISSLHCILERRGQRIRVHDQSSRNGVFFGGRREASFDIGAGDSFTVSTTTLLAMSDEMRSARPHLAEVLGYDVDELVDEVLVEAVRGGAVLVIAEKGSGQRRLVKAIHQASLRRTHALVLPAAAPSAHEIDNARRGTLVLAIGGEAIAQDLVLRLLSPDAHVRLAVLAPSLDAAVKSLGVDAVARLHKIVIRPLRERVGDLERLIDRLFVEQRASLRLSELTPRNQAAIREHPWPENLDELRKAADMIALVAREGSTRKAAVLLNIPRSTLQYMLDALDLELPLVADPPAP